MDREKYVTEISDLFAEGKFEEAYARLEDMASARAEELRGPAEAGDSKAQYSLGLLYQDGVGVKKDFPLALSLYKKAAESAGPALWE